jgi:hypothetical protein
MTYLVHFHSHDLASIFTFLLSLSSHFTILHTALSKPHKVVKNHTNSTMEAVKKAFHIRSKSKVEHPPPATEAGTSRY